MRPGPSQALAGGVGAGEEAAVHVRVRRGSRWRGGRRDDEQRPRGVMSVSSYPTRLEQEKRRCGGAAGGGKHRGLRPKTTEKEVSHLSPSAA